MKRYLKLVNFEFNRIAKVFGVLLALVLLSQVFGVIKVAKDYVNSAEEWLNTLSLDKFIQSNGTMGMDEVISSVWFFAPIVLCIAAVAIYTFLIWYRDWFGKNTFIYRLLMLPTARMNIFLAKLTAILLVTFGFVAFQLIILPLEMMIFKLIVPLEFRLDMQISQFIGTSEELSILMPIHFVNFLLYYGAGIMIVSVLFTAILLERSYRMKGLVLGIVYCVLAGLLFLTPVLAHDIFRLDYLYSIEMIGLEVAAGAIVLAISLWVSKFLITNKVTV